MKQLLVPMVYKVDHENINSVSNDLKDGFLVHVFVTEQVYKEDYADIKDELYEKVIMPRIENGNLKRGNFTIGITNGEKYKGWLKLFQLENNTLPSAAAYFPVYLFIYYYCFIQTTEAKYPYGSFLFKDKYIEVGDLVDKLRLNMLKNINEKEMTEGEKIMNMMNKDKETEL